MSFSCQKPFPPLYPIPTLPLPRGMALMGFLCHLPIIEIDRARSGDMRLMVNLSLCLFALILFGVGGALMVLRQQPPDKQWIVFASRPAMRWELYRMESDGSNLQRLGYT